MTAKVITIANQKGGVGKTTVTMNLAGTLARAGNKVLVADADRQGTAQNWAASAPDKCPFPAAVVGIVDHGEHIVKAIRPFVKDYDFILVDCPPAADSPIPFAAMTFADIAIIPVEPTLASITATKGILTVIETAKEYNEALRAFLLPSRVVSKTNVSKSCLEELNTFGLPLLKTWLTGKVAYQEAHFYGGTVHNVPGPNRSIPMAEIESLTAEILSFFPNIPNVRRIA